MAADNDDMLLLLDFINTSSPAEHFSSARTTFGANTVQGKFHISRVFMTVEIDSPQLAITR